MALLPRLSALAATIWGQFCKEKNVDHKINQEDGSAVNVLYCLFKIFHCFRVVKRPWLILHYQRELTKFGRCKQIYHWFNGIWTWKWGYMGNGPSINLVSTHAQRPSCWFTSELKKMVFMAMPRWNTLKFQLKLNGRIARTSKTYCSMDLIYLLRSNHCPDKRFELSKGSTAKIQKNNGLWAPHFCWVYSCKKCYPF